MLNKCPTRQLNGCHNKERHGPLTTLVVQDGYVSHKILNAEGRIISITTPNMKTIPNRMDRSCKYDLNTTDPSCKGCRHIGVDYDGVQ
jgi:hypothetical protein